MHVPVAGIDVHSRLARCRPTLSRTENPVPMNRRQMLLSLAAGATAAPAWSLFRDLDRIGRPESQPRPLRRADARVDWRAVRALFPLAPDWTHLAAFLLVSPP